MQWGLCSPIRVCRPIASDLIILKVPYNCLLKHWFDWLSKCLTSHQTHYRSYRGRVFTGKMTQTNSVKALKEDSSKGLGFNPIWSTPPCSNYDTTMQYETKKKQIQHRKEVIMCLILDIRYLKRLSALGGLAPWLLTRGSNPWTSLRAPPQTPFVGWRCRARHGPLAPSRCAKLRPWRPCLSIDNMLNVV